MKKISCRYMMKKPFGQLMNMSYLPSVGSQIVILDNSEEY